MNKRERTSVETLDVYEYDSKERLGYGAFAIVFKGWMKEVSVVWMPLYLEVMDNCSLTNAFHLFVEAKHRSGDQKYSEKEFGKIAKFTWQRNKNFEGE